MKTVLLITLIVLSSCSNGNKGLTKSNNNQDYNSKIEYIQSNELLVTGDLDFGTVDPAITKTKTVTLKNIGAIPGRVKIDLTTIFQTNGIFSINYASSDCFVSGSYKILKPQYSCQIELILNSGNSSSGAFFAAIPLYDELAANTLIKNLQASVVISSTGSIPPVGKSCITAYHKDLITGKCVSDYKDCTPLISNSIIAKKHWNSVNQTFDACLATSCVPNYAPTNGGSSCALSSQTITINKLINQGISNIYDAGTNSLIDSCPANSSSCAILVPALSNIRIESAGASGYGFTSYSDSNCLGVNFACSKSNINSNLTITPLFSLQNYTLSVDILPSNLNSDATYSILKNGVACSTPACLSSFNFGQPVQITATPNSYVIINSITLSDSSRFPTGVNPILFVFGTSNITATINLVDKPVTVPSFSFNGTLSASLITVTANPLIITTSNIPMARQMLISESSNCSTGSYVSHASPATYTHTSTSLTKNISFKYKNNSQESLCYPYTLKVLNASRTCTTQPSNSTGGTESTTNGGTTWGVCSGFSCTLPYLKEGNSCVYRRSCLITNGVGTQIFGTDWGACTIVSCYGGYYNNGSACVVNSRACSPIGSSSPGTQTTSNGVNWSDCFGFSCDPAYHIISGACELNTRLSDCSLQSPINNLPTNASYNSGSTYTENYINNMWDTKYLNYASSGVCSFQCASGFTYNAIDNTCNNLAAVTTLTGGSTSGSAPYYCTILDYNAKAYCWGDNGSGELGNGYTTTVSGNVPTNPPSNTPTGVLMTGVLSGKTIQSIASGTSHSCVIASDNKAYCWGLNTSGQLGNGSLINSNVPVAVSTSGVLSGKIIKSLSLGAYHSCAITNEDYVYCWGNNGSGQLGNLSTTNSSSPVALYSTFSTTAFSKISAGSSTTCGITTIGAVFCWGNTSDGQSGSGRSTMTGFPVVSSINYPFPITLNGVVNLTGKTFKKISVGASTVCAIASDDRLYCWGLWKDWTGSSYGSYSNSQRTYPTPSDTQGALVGKTVKDVKVSPSHICAIANDDLVYCVGDNAYGQLGNNSSSNTATESWNAVITSGALNGKTIKSIANGRNSSCVVANDDNIYCWGQVDPKVSYQLSPIKRDSISTAMVSFIAGSYAVSGQVDGTGAAATFATAADLALDSSGNIYVSDNNKVRKITPQGVVTTFAGGAATSMDGVGTAAGIMTTYGVVVDSNGNLFITENGKLGDASAGGNRIRKITPDGTVSVFAGSGAIGSADGVGIAATFNKPNSIAIDKFDNLYIGDGENFKIRKITPQGVVSTLAGNGTYGATNGSASSASFARPWGIAVDSTGTIVYVAEFETSSRIRKISGGVVSTIAGTGAVGSANGVGIAASFNHPRGLAMDKFDNLYIADADNNKIRVMTPSGVVSDFVGNGVAGATNGSGMVNFNKPWGLKFDAAGNLYVSEQGAKTIRKITP